MFETRIKSLQDLLESHEIDALIVTSSYNISYLSGISAFSIEEREARILVTKTNLYFFTDARYTEMVKQNSPFVTLVEISSSNRFIKQLGEVLEKENVQQLGFEEENITYAEAADIEENITSVDLLPTQNIVEDMRTIKDNDEIDNIKAACKLTDDAFEFILPHLKPGVTELVIKSKLEGFIREKGGETSFASIVAFGPNSAIPHHVSTPYTLHPTTSVLLDFGAKVNGYCSDMTRTVFLGEPNTELTKIYNAVKEAQEVALDYLKTHMDAGFELKKAHELANSHLRSVRFEDIPHGLGHGVGLQVHEQPSVSLFSDELPKPGMIITVEPGVYIPGWGGVRIEDTVLITTEGLEILTKSKKDFIQIH